jgi:hypothetical protein
MFRGDLKRKADDIGAGPRTGADFWRFSGIVWDSYFLSWERKRIMTWVDMSLFPRN